LIDRSQPAAGDFVMAQPTTTPFTGLVRAREPPDAMPPRPDVIPRTALSAEPAILEPVAR
jgi:hypothetical protein